VTVLVGGVSELFQGDLDLGRLAVERLRGERLGPDTVVEDLYYGAVAVAQRLQDLRPQSLVLVGATRRGRPPGAVERRRVRPPAMAAAEFQLAVGDAVVGYVDIDLVIQVAAGLGALPARTVAVEVEPVGTESAQSLSALAASGLEAALELVRAEVRRAPLLGLADQLRERAAGCRLEPAPAPALDTLERLLAELDILDRDGRWGRSFALRDRLRLQIAAGETGAGMDHLDWGLWWTLIEELDRLEPLEAGVLPQ